MVYVTAAFIFGLIIFSFGLIFWKLFKVLKGLRSPKHRALSPIESTSVLLIKGKVDYTFLTKSENPTNFQVMRLTRKTPQKGLIKTGDEEFDKNLCIIANRTDVFNIFKEEKELRELCLSLFSLLPNLDSLSMGYAALSAQFKGSPEKDDIQPRIASDIPRFEKAFPLISAKFKGFTPDSPEQVKQYKTEQATGRRIPAALVGVTFLSLFFDNTTTFNSSFSLGYLFAASIYLSVSVVALLTFVKNPIRRAMWLRSTVWVSLACSLGGIALLEDVNSLSETLLPPITATMQSMQSRYVRKKGTVYSVQLKTMPPELRGLIQKADLVVPSDTYRSLKSAHVIQGDSVKIIVAKGLLGLEYLVDIQPSTAVKASS